MYEALQDYLVYYTSIGLMAPCQSNCKLHHDKLSTHYTYWTAHHYWGAKTSILMQCNLHVTDKGRPNEERRLDSNHAKRSKLKGMHTLRSQLFAVAFCCKILSWTFAVRICSRWETRPVLFTIPYRYLRVNTNHKKQNN